MIEKKILIIGLFVLFLLPASALAADGDSSPGSTIVFRETLPDDIMFYPDNETHGTGYAKSFADVSDWATWEGTGISSDGDEGYFDVAGDEVFDRYYSNEISFASGTQHYVEVRIRANVTLLQAIVQVYTLDDHAGTGTSVVILTNAIGTTGATGKALFSGSHAIESIGIIAKHTAAARVYVDYLRVGNETEMGWQHDGSTTAGTEEQTRSGWTYTITSSGGLLNLTYSRSGGTSGYGDIYLNFDTTSTEADIETDYYPFMEISWSCPVQTASNVRAYWYVDGKTQGAASEFIGGMAFYGTFSSRTDRQTINALTGNGGATKGIRFLTYGADGEKAVILIDYVKAYSIANFTVTQSGVGTDDYLYVSGGTLISTVDSGYIELDHDPTLSVAPDTYPLYYNLSTTGTAPEFSMYVSSWSTYSDETRGIISSRIVTDIKLKFDSTEIISGIVFAMDDISIFSELFLSLDMWGYLGPMAMIVIGYVLAKKDTFLGILWFVVECLFVAQYLTLVAAMPNYWWHIFILLLGGLFTCVYPLLNR